MKLPKLLLVVATPLCVMSCCGRPVEGGDIGEGSQEILDSLSVEAQLAVLALDQVAVASAQPTADGIAQALAARINTERVGCATAAVDAINAAQVSVTFSDCALGVGEQDVKLNGTLTAVIEVNNQAVSFSNTATSLQINDISTNDATTIIADLANNTVSFTRDISFSIGPDALTISAAGSLLLDDVAKTASVDATYDVTANGATRTHSWSDVVLSQGSRLPLSGQVVIADAVGGELQATLSNEGELFTLDATQSGTAQSFTVEFRDAEPALFQACSPVATDSIQDRAKRGPTAAIGLGCLLGR